MGSFIERCDHDSSHVMRWFAEEEAPARPVTFLDKVCLICSEPVLGIAHLFVLQFYASRDDSSEINAAQ